jgi:Tol biopolymer transport system component
VRIAEASEFWRASMNADPRPPVATSLRIVLAVLVWTGSAKAQYPITRVSVDSAGRGGDKSSGVVDPPWAREPAFSSDGRHVAFASLATDLVANDGNGCADVFVHDRATGATVRVSVDSSGIEGDLASEWTDLSSDGRFVAFQSAADNLVAGDTNGKIDVFLHDRDPDGNGIFDEGNGVTTRISVDSAGVEGDGDSLQPAISGDGSRVAFYSVADDLIAYDHNGWGDVFVRFVASGTTTSPSRGGDGTSWYPAISSDGKFVAFESQATNLVPGDTNYSLDILVRDLVNQTTARASVDSSGNQGNQSSYGPCPLSSDGHVVAFWSDAGSLVSGDTNAAPDVFVHDFSTGLTTRVSVRADGSQFEGAAWPGLSADGSLVAFENFKIFIGSEGTPYWDDFAIELRDLGAGTTTRLDFNCAGAPPNDNCFMTSISPDGRLVGFLSAASDLAAEDTNDDFDVFVDDRSIVEPDATWDNYGAGYPGTLGIPDFTLSDKPVIGTSIDVDVGNSSGNFAVAFVLIGSNSASTGTHDGGTLLVDFDRIDPIALWPAGLTVHLDLPVDPRLAGLELYLQAVEIDPGAQYGLSFTPGLHFVCGL